VDSIYVIGDEYTVMAFRVLGVKGHVADRHMVSTVFEEVLATGDAGLIIVTAGIAENLSESISTVNTEKLKPVVIVIPGLDDTEGFGKSILSFVTEALGISVRGE